jgi:hypothetical protein
MSDDKNGKQGKTYFSDRTPVEMVVVSILGGKLENRGLELIEPISRAVRLHEIHEWIFTNEHIRDRTKPINKISYFAFAEVVRGGIILVGDKVLLNGNEIGNIVGFDDTHMPNHQNIIVGCKKRVDGVQLGTKLGDVVSIINDDLQ